MKILLDYNLILKYGSTMKKLNTTHSGTENRKQQILAAALSSFTEKGFTETSITDICKEAGASTGSVYHHFKSKEKLAAAVYLEGIRHYQGIIMRALEAEEKPRDGIFAIIYNHIKWVEDHPDWAKFLFQKRYAEFMGETEKEMALLNADFFSAMAKWFRGHIEAGLLRRFPKDIFVSVLMGPCQEFVRLYISGKATTDIKTAAQYLTEACWSSLGI